MKSDFDNDPYVAGWLAFEERLGRDANPFTSGPEYVAWRNGWDDAREAKVESEEP